MAGYAVLGALQLLALARYGGGTVDWSGAVISATAYQRPPLRTLTLSLEPEDPKERGREV
jgi:hypothetical protein